MVVSYVIVRIVLYLFLGKVKDIEKCVDAMITIGMINFKF